MTADEQPGFVPEKFEITDTIGVAIPAAEQEEQSFIRQIHDVMLDGIPGDDIRSAGVVNEEVRRHVYRTGRGGVTGAGIAEPIERKAASLRAPDMGGAAADASLDIPAGQIYMSGHKPGGKNKCAHGFHHKSKIAARAAP